MNLTMLAFAMALAQAAPNPQALAPMPDWLSGSWQDSQGDKWSEENWTDARGHVMLGNSRSGRGMETGFWEQMRIERSKDGTLSFWATAGEQPPVRFVASHVGYNAIVFENPAHDYPQRIRYWREGDQLKAEISLIDGSRVVGFAFARAQ